MQDNSLNKLIIVSPRVKIATKCQNNGGYLGFLGYLSLLSYLGLLSFWGQLQLGVGEALHLRFIELRGSIVTWVNKDSVLRTEDSVNDSINLDVN
jgi:hypothetical protein